jgi:hypothetical protein
MSNVNANDNQGPVLPSIHPPANTRGGLDPRQQLRPREVTGATAEGFQPAANEVSPVAGKTGIVNYTGQFLVDERGVVVRPQYSGTYEEAYQELAKMDTAERKAFLNSLYKVGAYEGQKPSNTGFDNSDFAAVVRAMNWANPAGYTLKAALPLMAAEIGPVVSSGPRIRTTAAQDLRAVFKQATQSVLGRDVGDAEVEKFIRAYQGMEVREQTGGATAPAPQTAAVEQVEQSFEEEAGAMGMLQLSNAFSQALKGLS